MHRGRRILVVDDHHLFAESLSVVLAQLDEQPVAVDVAASAEGALSLLSSATRFDLVLLDLGLPGLSGRAAFHALRSATPDVPIVLVTASEPSGHIHELIQEGARGFVHKRSRTSELLAALRYVLDGGTHIPPQLTLTPAVAEDALALTPRQREVLAMLARGLCNKDIAKALSISEATVRVHVSSVMRALSVENRTQAATSPYARRLIEG